MYTKKIRNPGLVRLTSLELGISEEIVNEIASVQSSFIAHTMRDGAFEGVILPYLGKIKVDPKRLQHYNWNKGQPNIQKPGL